MKDVWDLLHRDMRGRGGGGDEYKKCHASQLHVIYNVHVTSDLYPIGTDTTDTHRTLGKERAQASGHLMTWGRGMVKLIQPSNFTMNYHRYCDN